MNGFFVFWVARFANQGEDVISTTQKTKGYIVDIEEESYFYDCEKVGRYFAYLTVMRHSLNMPLFKNINRRFLWTATGLIGCLCVVSFFAAWGRDEGTLGEGGIANLLADAFVVLRLPFHLLLWPVMELSSKLSGQLAFLLFFVGLFGNSLFYSLILERTYYFVVGTKRTKVNQLENDA